MNRFWDFLEKCLYFIIYKIFKLKLNSNIFQHFTQFIKFGIVGLSNTLISYIVYVLLIFAGFNYLLASIVGFVASVVNSFYWNNKYVFTGTNSRVLWKAFVKTFLSYAGTGLVLSNILLYFWVDLVHVHEMVAPVINLFITIPLNFIFNKLWAFKE